MIDIFELKKFSILEDQNIKNYIQKENVYLKIIKDNINLDEITKIKSSIDFRKVYEYKFLTQYKYTDILQLLSNNTEIFNEKNWINHIRHLYYYNRYLSTNNKRFNYTFHNISNIQEFYAMLKKHYEPILIKQVINPFKSLSKTLNKQGHFILTLYENNKGLNQNINLYKYKVPYNILTEGDLLNLCVLRLKELLIYIYPNLKDILTPNKEDEKYKRIRADKVETTKLKEQYINDEMIIKYLLPFINTEHFKDIYTIKSLDELYTTKINDKVDKNHQQPINFYYYTNYTCDHTLSISKDDPFFKQSNRTYTNNSLNNGLVYYSFNVDDFILNANAIFKTIIYTENKLYINWINVFPYTPTYNLLLNSPFYNRHNYLPTINSQIDLTELFFLSTLDYNILESPIDDILFSNNTINAYYCYYKNISNKNIYPNWYTFNYYEITYNLYSLFNNNILTFSQENLTNSLKLLYTQGKITDLFTPDYKKSNEHFYQQLIKNNVFDKKVLFEKYIKTKNEYDNIIQYLINYQNKYRKYIIQTCNNSYYFMPINYISLRIINNKLNLSNRIDYEQVKDIQTNINLKIINDMIMFYNRKKENKTENEDKNEIESKVSFFELYTYFYKFMLKVLDTDKLKKIVSFDFNALKEYFDKYFKNKNYNSKNDVLFNNSIIYLFKHIKILYEVKFNETKIQDLENIIELNPITNKKELKKEYRFNIDCLKEIYEKFIKDLNTVLEFCYNNDYSIEVNDGETYNILDKIDNSTFLGKTSSKYIFNSNIEKLNGYLYHTYWGEFFSMYYLEQINIFNKYLNNRIIYATGATGTGKSTQLPKLLLYAGTVLDNNPYYHILCSEPRQRPTSENAINISKQFSSPILPESFDSKNNKLEYYLQYKHGNDKKHYFNNPKYPVLTFATDKIVYQNICNNPLCCSYKVNTITSQIQIEEIYNMIIVDEAHEHNVNMDFILSIMKYYCHHNNRIKLVIISATMDLDEDKYRKFYDTVNDLVYDHTIKTIYNEEFLENRKIINPKTNKIYTYAELNDDKLELSNDNKQKLYQTVDRRLDISEPNKTTIYKIDDKYINMTSEELQNENLKDDKITKIIFDILKDNNAKDILVFKSGQKPINKLVKEINQKLPSDSIALPYYSVLNDKVKDFIEHLSKYRNQIDISKNIDVSTLTDTKDFINGSPSYKHYILIATNIAEASITIPTLTHVIDDGVQNVSKYDYKYESAGLTTGYIANTNRLQRRGRVGRKADGTVYYLYKEGALDGQAQEYNICNSNIIPDLVDLFTNDFLKNKIITENNELNKKFKQQDLIVSITNINKLLLNIQIDNIIENGLLNIPINNLQIINNKDDILKQLDIFKNSINYINEYCINGKIDLKLGDNVIRIKAIFGNSIINVFRILLNKILLYPNLSIDDFIELSIDNDKNTIIWADSYKLNKKYSGYLKVENGNNFDKFKEIYKDNKIILMSSICATNSDEIEKNNIQSENKILTGGMNEEENEELEEKNKKENEKKNEENNEEENGTENETENEIENEELEEKNNSVSLTDFMKFGGNINYQYFNKIYLNNKINLFGNNNSDIEDYTENYTKFNINSDSDTEYIGGKVFSKDNKTFKKSGVSKSEISSKKTKSFNKSVNQKDMPINILNQYQKKEYIKYKIGFYYDVLLKSQYNFFNISPNEPNIIRDIFGNIVFINEIMPNNMKKYLVNTYGNLNLIEHSNNNLQIIHTDEYELINSLIIKLDSHYEYLPQIIIGLCIAYSNNCINLYLIYAAVILNYNELSKIRLNKYIKYDSELQYYVNQYINNEMDKYCYKQLTNTINLFNKIITETENNKEYEIFKDLVVRYKDFLYIEDIPSETERIKIILICIFKNKLVVNLPSEYLKVIHPLRKNPNFIIGPNSKIPNYIYRNIYISITNPSQNVIKRYNDYNQCNEHDFVLYLSDMIENDGLHNYVIISLTIPFDPNYLKYIYIDRRHIINQLNKPSIDIYYRRCLEMLLKYIN